jgi:hypothetical protein
MLDVVDGILSKARAHSLDVPLGMGGGGGGGGLVG